MLTEANWGKARFDLSQVHMSSSSFCLQPQVHAVQLPTCPDIQLDSRVYYPVHGKQAVPGQLLDLVITARMTYDYGAPMC